MRVHCLFILTLATCGGDWLSERAIAQQAVDRLEAQLGEPSVTAPAPDDTAASESRAYLGVMADDRQEQGRGVRIVDVAAGGPADRARLRIGDLITAIDGQAIGSMADLGAIVEQAQPEQRLAIAIQRGEQSLDVSVTLGTRPVGSRGGGARPDEASVPRQRLLGARTIPVTPEAQQILGLTDARGALVSEVFADSPAAKAGLPVDAVIVAIDGRRVANPLELARRIGMAGAGKEVELTIVARGEKKSIRVMLGGMDEAMSAEAGSPPAGAESAAGGDGELAERVRQLEERLNRLEALLRRLAPASEAPASGDPK
ncbi:MAG: PDZ domain-containing protein [Pirellulales bacterium]|nr:PDZ domain-containing protein [Pirellulales bacterium]